MYVQIYLRPWDNHRFVAPADFAVEIVRHIPGRLLPLFFPGSLMNERVVLAGKLRDGRRMMMAFIGALNVGNIVFHQNKVPFFLSQGQEIGYF